MCATVCLYKNINTVRSNIACCYFINAQILISLHIKHFLSFQRNATDYHGINLIYVNILVQYFA